MADKCCRNFSEAILHTLNALVMIFGLLILSVGAYLLVNVEDDFKEVGLGNPIIASLVFGTFLFVFGLIGVLGTCWDNKCLLLIYIFGVLFLGIAILASGIVLLVFAGKFENVQDGQAQDAGEEKILNFELAMFQKCCADQFIGVADVRSCDDPPGPQLICFTDQQQFDDFEQLFDEDTCKLLEDLELRDGTKIVGPPTNLDGSCGNGFAFVFVNNVNQYVDENLRMLGAANIVAGVVILLMLIAACVILWTKEDERRKQQAMKNKQVGCF